MNAIYLGTPPKWRTGGPGHYSLTLDQFKITDWPVIRLSGFETTYTLHIGPWALIKIAALMLLRMVRCRLVLFKYWVKA